VIMMIAVIGGRIVPSFTRNWLVKRAPGRLPVPPMQRFDKALLAFLAGLLAWVALPDHQVTGVLLLVAGGLHLVRLARWAGDRTLSEPLVAVLHLGYAFLPLGALASGCRDPCPRPDLGMAAAQHLWMGGAAGLMTLAVMTRATLGHTGQALTAGPGTVLASMPRWSWQCWPGLRRGSGRIRRLLHMVAGAWLDPVFWGFALIYGRLLLRLPAAKRI
jgi:uncharacterized protein involved in response to NO